MQDNDYTPEELKHYGVLGMKWGIRRFQPYPKGSDSPKGRFLGKLGRSKQKSKSAYAMLTKEEAAQVKKVNSDSDRASAQKSIASGKPSLKQLNAEAQRQKDAKKAAKDQKKAEKHKTDIPKKDVKRMTDAELKDVVQRLQMEKRYSELTAVQKSAGQKFVEDIVMNQGKKAAEAYIKKWVASMDERVAADSKAGPGKQKPVTSTDLK